MIGVYAVVSAAVSLDSCTILIYDNALCIASSTHCCSSMGDVVILSCGGGGPG